MRIFLAALGAVLVVLGHGFVAASAATVSLNQEMAAPIEESGDAVAAQCWQGNCSYRDPVDAGCNGGAVTPRELTLNDIRIEYRYSSSCDASWSRMTILTPNIGCAAGSVWHEKRYNDGQIVKTPDSCSWSQMLGKGNGSQTRSCGFSSAQQACTEWRFAG